VAIRVVACDTAGCDGKRCAARRGVFWSGLEYAPDTFNAWYFNTYYGHQDIDDKLSNPFALAVRPGDVAAPIPEPETYALMLAGLALVGAAGRGGDPPVQGLISPPHNERPRRGDPEI
jgi:hypothetical protein